MVDMESKKMIGFTFVLVSPLIFCQGTNYTRAALEALKCDGPTSVNNSQLAARM